MTREEYWDRFRARQKGIEKRFAPQMNTEIRKQFNSFLYSIKVNGYQYSKARIDSIIKFDGVARVLKQLYKVSGYVESNYVYSSLIRDKRMEIKRLGGPATFGVGFDELGSLVDEYFRIYQLSKSAIPISETTKKYIRNHLINKVDFGTPLDQAIRQFRELALTSGEHPDRVISRSRAKNIILTESTRAMNFGGLIGAHMTGIDLDKVWVTCHDERVRQQPVSRFSHRVLDRQYTDMMGAFNNGENIKFPGDPEASEDNTINCRCTMFFKEKERAKPRVKNRSITSFLTDFFLGTIFQNVFNELLTEALIEENG